MGGRSLKLTDYYRVDVAMRLRCGGIFNEFVTGLGLLLITTMKEF